MCRSQEIRFRLKGPDDIVEICREGNHRRGCGRMYPAVCVVRFDHEPDKRDDNKLTFDFAARKYMDPLLTEGRWP